MPAYLPSFAWSDAADGLTEGLAPGSPFKPVTDPEHQKRRPPSSPSLKPGAGPDVSQPTRRGAMPLWYAQKRSAMAAQASGYDFGPWIGIGAGVVIIGLLGVAGYYMLTAKSGDPRLSKS